MATATSSIASTTPATPGQTRERALSHKEYLDTLHRPSAEEWHRISDYQRQKEVEIDRKYHSSEAYNAATTIQKAYRGHRARRELQGLTLDPSSRWTEVIRELRFRGATVPQQGPRSPERRLRAPSDVAKRNWVRVGRVAEHAGGGGEVRGTANQQPNDCLDAEVGAEVGQEDAQEPAESMLMDSRYFLEMVDQKHRYGTNLQVYHEEWLRSGEGQNFFYWLDYGDGNQLNLPGCSRAKLDKESIRYLSRDERLAYLVDVDDEGKLRWHKNSELITTSAERYRDSLLGVVPREATDAPAFNDEEIVRQRSADRAALDSLLRVASLSDAESSSSDSSAQSSTIHKNSSTDQTSPPGNAKKKKKHHPKHLVSPATILNRLLRASIKPGTWIYVADTVGRLYVGIKASGAFQHASFLSGARISSAGSIGIEDGRLAYLSPLSGHYRPTTRSFKLFVESLKRQNVDLSHLRVSHAFEVLETLEVYGRSKKGVKRVLKGKHGEKERDAKPGSPGSPGLDGKLHVANDDASATGLVDRHWEKEHKSSLGRMMEELKIRRR